MKLSWTLAAIEVAWSRPDGHVQSLRRGAWTA